LGNLQRNDHFGAKDAERDNTKIDLRVIDFEGVE